MSPTLVIRGAPDSKEEEAPPPTLILRGAQNLNQERVSSPTLVLRGAPPKTNEKSSSKPKKKSNRGGYHKPRHYEGCRWKIGKKHKTLENVV